MLGGSSLDVLVKLLEGVIAIALSPQNMIMIVIGVVLIALAIVKEYEPTLLLPIGFGCILANIPFSEAVKEHGFLTFLYDTCIETELFPILIFIAIGAMIDFTPLLTQPVTLFFGAAAQMGIYGTFLLAVLINFLFPETFTLLEAAAIGIIGAADGPTSIFVGTRFAPKYIAAITVAAYSYMALVPMIQPPVIRALTTKEERRIRMDLVTQTEVPRYVRIVFPIMVTIISGILVPMSTALIGSLMFGNLIRECGVLDRLSDTAQNELSRLVTLLMGITVGSQMFADTFLTLDTLMILSIGLLAFAADTAGGVLFAKFCNLFLKKKINPMIGACGISAFPMSARIVQKMAIEEDPGNFILMQAIGANVAGQVASVVAGSLILTMLS